MHKRSLIIGAILTASILIFFGFLVASPSGSPGKVKDLRFDNVRVKSQAPVLDQVTTDKQILDPAEATEWPVFEAQQGGDNIATATVVPSMNTTLTGTTAGFLDDYEEQCATEADQNFPDVVYSYTPSTDDMLVNISSCNSSYFTRLWVYENSTATVVACNRFSNSCGSPPRAAVLNVEMYVGNTYYIVVDGDNALGDSPGPYELNCTATILNPTVPDSSFIHPAIAYGDPGQIMLAYEYNVVDTFVLWSGSIDDGANFTGVGGWVGEWYYPAVDFWGATIFYGTMVAGPSESNGGATYLAAFPDAANDAGWSLSYWDWSSFGWSGMKSTDIACDDGLAAWQWGIISFVGSTTYGSGVSSGPFVTYQTTDAGQATISWYYLDSCATTTVDIDPINQEAFAVYDFFDTTAHANTWGLFLRQEFMATLPHPPSNAWTFLIGANLEHTQYPSVAAYDGNVVIAAQYWNESARADKDIVCFYGVHDNLDSMETSVIAGSTDDETFPKMAHIMGNTFACTYVKTDTLYGVMSEDAGATWGTPFIISLVPDDDVVDEFHTADISEEAKYVAWEYQMYGDPDTSIFIHFGSSGIVFDADGDGIPDDEDNCPNTPNPGQEDGDFDGVGDVCDNCPNFLNPGQEDADLDGVGDFCDACPGFDDNVDADGDGVPDGCDICPGYDDLADGDSDDVPDSCDNCPDTFNPGQEDSNDNGVGDVCDYICGDANGDLLVNVGDAVFLINYVFKGGAAPDPLEAGDANCDSLTNVGDAVYIINFVFKAGPPPCASCK